MIGGLCLGVLLLASNARVEAPYARVTLPNTPFAVAVAAGGATYVTELKGRAVVRIGPGADSVTAVIDVGQLPSQVRIGRSGRVYVGNQDAPSIGVVDGVAGRQTAEWRVAQSVLTFGVSQDESRVYALTAGRGVQVLDGRNGELLTTVEAGAILTGIAFDPTEPRLYVAARESGRVTAINTRTNRAFATLVVEGSPQNLAVSPDGEELYATDIEKSRLLIWNLRTGMRTATIGLGRAVRRNAFDVAVTPDGTQLWVSLLADSQVVVLDRASHRLLRIISTGGSPRYIAFEPKGAFAVIANEAGWVDFVR